ncbi:MAG: M56 family metallopeptidase [Firmicutes bacterium]|nr:M56 family metallopeptidase [Bacillota bacterium]
MTYFLLLSLVCGILILLIATITKIFGNKLGRKWRYVLWLVLAIRMLIPVDISIPTPVFTVELPPIEESQVIESEDRATVVRPQSGTTSVGNSVTTTTPGTTPSPAPSPTTPSVTTPSVVEPELSWDWSMILSRAWNTLPWIWLAGALLSAAWFLGGYWYQRRTMLRWSYASQSQELWESFNHFYAHLAIAQPVELRICKRIASPMMMGLLKPVLLMPERNYGERELEYIFRHELLHIQRRDIWAKSLVILVRILHWFNPTVVLMSQEISEDIEILCDGQVVRDMDDSQRREYNQVLLQHLAHRREETMAFSTCFGSRMQKMKDRFVQVSRSGKLKKGYIITVILLVMVLVGSLLMSCRTEEAEDEPGKGESSVAEDLPMANTVAAAMAKAYRDIIVGVIDEYGAFSEEDSKMDNGAVRLLDFDGDGKEELFCAYNVKEQGEFVIYQYNDIEAIQIYKGSVTHSEVSGGWLTHFVKVDGKVYINVGADDATLAPRYIGWDGAEWNVLLEYDEAAMVLNGETVNEADLARGINLHLFPGKYDKIYYERPSGFVQKKNERVVQELEEIMNTGTWETSELMDWAAINEREYAEEQENISVGGILRPELEYSAEMEQASRYSVEISNIANFENARWRLIDFDLDGEYELFLAYGIAGKYYQSICRWSDRERGLYLVYESELWQDLNGDPCVWFRVDENGTYLYNEVTDEYWTLRDSEWTEVGTIAYRAEQVINYTHIRNDNAKWVNLATRNLLSEGAQTTKIINAIPVDTNWTSRFGEDPTVYEAYLPIIESLRQTYGEGYVDTVDGENVLRGLGMVWLVDFDRDGLPELCCAYETPGSGIVNQEEIYQYQNGEAVLIYQGPVSNHAFVYQEKEEYTQYCIRDKDTIDGADIVSEARILVDGEMQTIHHGLVDEDGNHWLNGEQVDFDTCSAAYFQHFGQWFNTYIFYFKGNRVEGPYYHYIFS